MKKTSIHEQIKEYIHFWGFHLSHACIHEIAESVKDLDGEDLSSEIICLVHEKVDAKAS